MKTVTCLFSLSFLIFTSLARADGYECSTPESLKDTKYPPVGSCIALYPTYQYQSQRLTMNASVDRASRSLAYNLFSKPPQPFFQLSEIDLTTGKILAQKNFERATPFESSFFIDEQGMVRGFWEQGGVHTPFEDQALKTYEIPQSDWFYKQGYFLQTNRPFPRPSPLSPTSLFLHCQRKKDKQTGVCHLDGLTGKVQRFVVTPYTATASPKGNYLAGTRQSPEGNFIVVVDSLTGETVLDLKLNSKYAPDVQFFSDDGRYLTLTENGVRVKVISIVDKKVVFEKIPTDKEGYPYRNPYSMQGQLLPGAKCVAVGGFKNDTTLVFYGVESGEPVGEAKSFNYASSCSKPIRGWGTSRDGKYLYVIATVQCGSFSDAIKRFEIPQACISASPNANSSKQ